MVENGRLQIATMKGRCSEQEWQARVDLAACYRLVDLYGLSDMMANHISMRVPDEEGAFLINACGINQPGTRRPYGLMEWPALLRKLDRLDPSYKT